MPILAKRRWEPDLSFARNRADARSFDYEAYIPDPIASWTFDIPFNLAEELVATSKAVTELQGLSTFTGLESLSRQLLRAESIGSSRIEGLILSQRRLARAMLDPKAETETARAVAGNIQAMETAIRLASDGREFQIDDLLTVHSKLLEKTRDAEIAGRLRDKQNWIGGSDWSPQDAEFIPPPETEVERLLEDLCVFLKRDDIPPLIQAAIAHAHFETIHPFIDGNGRVGRALIHIVLRRREVTPAVVPPISLVLATNAQRYVEGLTAYRSGNFLDWCLFFTRALFSATEQAKQLNERLTALQAEWRSILGRPRRHSAAERLIQALPAQPVLDFRSATNLVGGSDEAVRKALNELEAAGVLTCVTVGKKKNRIWEARELLTLVDHFEWQLATPTRLGAPRRPSPQRPEERG